MIQASSKWLPVGAANREPVRNKIASAADKWATKWFARNAPVVAACRLMEVGASSVDEDAPWRLYTKGLAISSSKRATAQLLSLALDADISSHDLSDPDRRVLSAFETEIFVDLAQTLSELLVEPPQPPAGISKGRDPLRGRGGLVVDMGKEGGGHLFSVALPFAALLPLCASTLAPPKHPTERLVRLFDALGASKLRLEAILGQVDLLVSDIEQLSCGDVLIFGQGLEATAYLAAPHSGSEIVRGSLCEADGPMALAIRVNSQKI
jgi:hypothetical protein